MDRLLLVNACVRQESRTRRLAEHLIGRLPAEVQEIRTWDAGIRPLDEAWLAERTELSNRRDFSRPEFQCARQFAAADLIVVAAPYWDMSFPASLKEFFEAVNVVGLTFAYDEAGVPHGLCRAKKLYYVTSAGGKIQGDFGFGYVRELCRQFFEIPEVTAFAAEGLDLPDADVETILKRTMDEMDQQV